MYLPSNSTFLSNFSTRPTTAASARVLPSYSQPAPLHSLHINIIFIENVTTTSSTVRVACARLEYAVVHLCFPVLTSHSRFIVIIYIIFYFFYNVCERRRSSRPVTSLTYHRFASLLRKYFLLKLFSRHSLFSTN